MLDQNQNANTLLSSDVVSDEASILWDRFLSLIKQNISELKYNTWFKPIKVKSFSDNKLLLSVPSSDFFDIIINRFGDYVYRALSSIHNEKLSLEYVVEPLLQNYVDVSFCNSVPYVSPASNPEEITTFTKPAFIPTIHLNPEYTFENFVKGKNNDFAVAAALSISNRPGAQYNPLMIYGGVGLGKTHLVQAIANNLLLALPNTRMMYISGPEFTTGFVQSIRSNKAHEFERFYKSLDILIVDDVQFLEGKESTQDSFFQIFNQLYQLKKQIILSCDKPPHQLEGLEERLITRFQWGLTVDIQPPDLETRIAILNKKCDQEEFSVSYSVLEFIALNIKDNIRSLEGCLKSIVFESEISRQPISVDLAKRSIIKFGTTKSRSPNIDISSIISIISKFFEIDESLIRLRTKRQEVVVARQVAMYFSKEITSCSLQTIGAHFGGRSHATVIHACKCVEGMVNDNLSFSKKIEKLREDLLTS